MGFNKNKFVREIEIKVPFKVLQAEEQNIEEDAIFTVSVQKHKEVEQVNEWYFGLDQEQREDTKVVLDFVIKTVCASFTKEPKGFDDFPTDDRSLYERAVEYFTGNEEDIQSEFDDMLAYVYNQRNVKVDKNTFPSLPNGSQGDSGVQPENSEGTSE